MHLLKAYKNIKGKLVPDKLNNEDTNAFNMLMLQGSLMNDNSFGYFTPKHSERVAKKYDSRAYPKIVDAPFVVGHNRFATKGESTKKNAHPFQSSRFTWVHNGIIDNDVFLRNKYKLKIRSPVDSAIIGHLVEHFTKKHKTVEDAIKKAIEKISGDYSIFLYDKLTNRLFYFRNSLRTFETALLKLKNNRYILIGSTNRNNLKLTYNKSILNFDIQDAVILSQQEIQPDKIFEVNGNGFESVKHFKPLARTVSWGNSSNYYTNDLDNYKDIRDLEGELFTQKYLSLDIVSQFRESVEKMGFNISITPKEDNVGIKGVFIYGKDADEFIDIYVESFSSVLDFTMTANKVIEFLEIATEPYIEE